jgi:uncharacterized membrane protein
MPAEEVASMAAPAEDLRIIGITVDSRQAADEAVDQLDAKVESGQVSIREVAIVYKTASGKVKVDYVHSHAVLIGAAIGLGWAVLGIGGTVATGGALLPLFIGGAIGAGVDTGIGAAIGHAVGKHRRQESKDFLKTIGDSVQAGGAAVLVAADPANADKLLADMRASYPGHHSINISAAEQEDIIRGAHQALAQAS